MRIGVSLTSHHPDLTPAEAIETTVRRARAAAEAGCDHLSLGDQHAVGPDGSYLQGVPTLGRLLGEWPADRSAGLLFLLPLWHPVTMAEMIGTLAAMSEAPFVVQTGIGSGADRFAAMGADTASRGAVTDEAIPLVKRLLAGETVSSERFGIVDAAIGPIPTQPVEWWIGSGGAPAALDRAAREGDALYLSPHWTEEEIASLVVGHRARARQHGTPGRVVVRRDVLVGADHEAAVATADRLAASGYRGMARSVLVAGDPAAVAERFAVLAAAGVDDVVVRTPSVEPAVAERSIGLLGEVRSQMT